MVDEGELLGFEVDAEHPANSPMRFGWSFGDGTRLEPSIHGARTFAVYSDDGSYEAVASVEDAAGNVVTESVTVTVRNVAPSIEAVDRTGAAIEKTELGFRARAFDPGDDALTFTWDFGDGEVRGPTLGLSSVNHAYQKAGAFDLTITVDDGDGGVTTWTETIVVGEGFRFRTSGALSVGQGEGESPYLMGMPVTYDGERVRFAGDLMAGARGEAGADPGARCFVSFGSRAPNIGADLDEGLVVRFTGVLPNGLREDTYPITPLRNELPMPVVDPIEREWAAPGTFFATVADVRGEGFEGTTDRYHAVGGSVTVHTWGEGRVELDFSIGVEESFGPLDAITGPGGGLSYPPADQANLSGTFQHEIQRSMTGRSGSLNALSGEAYGDWYLCSPRDPLEVEQVVPDPGLADASINEVPLIEYRDPELSIRFSKPVDMGTVVEHVALEWRRADGGFESVPTLVMAESDTTVRLAPLQDLMDGVVYRARVVGGLPGVQGRAGETLSEDEEWLFETILDLSQARSGVTLATAQVARDAPLVAGKPTETRVYVNWREKPHVHPMWQTRYATFDVSIDGASYAPKRVRIKRMDLYSADERKHALDSVNFYGWLPGPGASHNLTARVTQAGQSGAERSFDGSWTASGYGRAEPLRIDYRFALVGSWKDGVPFDARSLGHRIARAGAVFTEQNFPVPHVDMRSLGDIRIDEPDQPIVTVSGEQFFLTSLLTVSRRDEDAASVFLDRIGGTSADVVVMLVPPDVMRLSGYSYSALGANPRVVAVQVDTGQANAAGYFGSTLAHEVGHAFGLRHGTDCVDLEVCARQSLSDAIEGTRIADGGAGGWNKSKWSGNAQASFTPGAVLALMHPENIQDDAVFITNENYAELQRAFRARSGEPILGQLHRTPGGPTLVRVQSVADTGLYVSGWVDPGTQTAEVTLVVPGTRPATGPREPAGSGSLRFEVLDRSGELLASAPVGPLEQGDPHAPGSGGQQPFVAFVPMPPGAASFAIVSDGQRWTQRVASEHAPAVTFDAAEFDLTQEPVLAWTATDADGDALTYDVSYTPDGRSWSTIATGVRATQLRVDPAVLVPGPAPAVQVSASDGFHHATAIARAIVPRAPSVLVAAPMADDVVPIHATVVVSTLGPIEFTGDSALRLETSEDGSAVAGHLEALRSGRGVRFVPATPLTPDTTYRARFGAGVTAGDGVPFGEEFDWTFRTGGVPVERSFGDRNLAGTPLTSAADEPSERDGMTLPESCAGIDRELWAPLIPAGATEVSASDVSGACEIRLATASDAATVRSFVERAILTNRFFLTSNRTDGDVIRIGLQGQGLSGEAVIEPGPPTRLRWILELQ